MTRRRKLTWSSVFVVAILLSPAIALADNCGSLYDCWGSAGAAAGAAAGAGAAAAGAAGLLGGKREEEDPCAGERRALLEAEGFADMVQNQINAYKKQIQGLGPPMQELLTKMGSLAGQARNEVLWYLLDQALDKIRTFLMGRIPIGSTGMHADQLYDVLTGADPTGRGSSVATGTYDRSTGLTEPSGYDAGIGDIAEFFGGLASYYTLLAGSWEQLGAMAEREGMTATKQYVDAMMQLRGLVNEGYALVNTIRQKEEELAERKRRAEEARAALENCMFGGYGSK